MSDKSVASLFLLFGAKEIGVGDILFKPHTTVIFYRKFGISIFRRRMIQPPQSKKGYRISNLQLFIPNLNQLIFV